MRERGNCKIEKLKVRWVARENGKQVSVREKKMLTSRISKRESEQIGK